MKLAPVLLVCLAALSAACHPGPIVNTNANKVGGTIAGIVTAGDPGVAVPGRKVTVIDVKTGALHDTTTATNGGYTIQVPEGTYRFEIELRDREVLAKQPGETHVNNSDLDAGRDFVITIGPRGVD
jgi:carboxypeptidase family protein